ncbi:MAG TPA: biosynthetic arginine decarboxylase [Gemmatimonadaceae bacterium]|jgi:arginine decarboxylase|nr:biosynthetic arginine decarboxylase [Gemmatimonadaceae bacterium]
MATETIDTTSASPDSETAWTVDKSRALYNVDGWGAGFFDIDARGHVVVRPDKEHPERQLSLYELASDLEEQGVALPVLLRFSDILRSRIEALSERFQNAIREYEYTGGYTTVYPIKVNQQRHVVEEIVQFGGKHGVGLECGSKPELQAVLGLSESTEHIIVCNGYKDEEFMRLALMGQKLGHQVFIVIEQLSEIDVLLSVADELGVNPTAGIRIKLASTGYGRWKESGGEKSKFGLNAAQLVQAVDKLRAVGRLDIVKLIHFHLGSQITDIRYIKSGLSEVARFYAELRALGVDVTHVDVGGGLGVDYDGTNSTSNASVNYSLQEYANDVIYTLAESCRELELPMPHVISESGRALTAHHALLLLKVIDVESVVEVPVPELSDDDHAVLHEMWADYQDVARNHKITRRRVKEIFHDVTFDKERAQQLFASGVLSLRGRAVAEQMYHATTNAIFRIVQLDREEYEDILADLDATMVDRYFCNFSLFQSLPDSWAIDQLFPIMPVHRLNEEPTRRGTLQDITCDSDGKIDRFVGEKEGNPTLELHEWHDGEPYVLGVFLTGAYQEILGDLHNLFGDTNAVHIRLTPTGYEITDLVHGDTVTEVLNYVQFRASDLLQTFRRKVTQVKHISRAEANAFIADYVAGLEGYTYLEGEAAQ